MKKVFLLSVALIFLFQVSPVAATTMNYTVSWASDLESFTWVSETCSGGGVCTQAFSSVDGNPAGSSEINVSGKNKRNTGYWKKTLTWEDMGVPVGATVNNIDGRFDVKLVQETHAATQSTGLKIYDSADTTNAITGDVDLETEFDPTSSSWVTRNSDVNKSIKAEYNPSSTSITIRMRTDSGSGNNNGAKTSIRVDNLVFTIDYTVTESSPPSLSVAQNLSSEVTCDIGVRGPAKTSDRFYYGNCSVSGGTAGNITINIMDNSSGTLQRSSTDPASDVFVNISEYNVSVANASNYYFNLTIKKGFGFGACATGTALVVQIQCNANNTAPLAANLSIKIDVNEVIGRLIANLNVSSNITSNQNSTFLVNASAMCVEAPGNSNKYARCYLVNATSRRNSTTSTIDTKISTTPGATPLWTSSLNEQFCGDMNKSMRCTTFWYVNASGTIGSSWAFDVNFSHQNRNGLSFFSNLTGVRTVNITGMTAQDTSFTIYIPATNVSGYYTGNVSSTEQILFNTTDPNGKKINASMYQGAGQNSTVSIFRYQNSGDTAFNITMAFAVSPTCSGGSISVKAGWTDSNYQETCNDYIDNGGCTEITTSTKHIANLSSTGAIRDVWLWADYDSCAADLDSSQTLTHAST